MMGKEVEERESGLNSETTKGDPNMSTNEERSTEVTRSAPAGTTGETPAEAQPRKRRIGMELPLPVAPLPGQTAIAGSGVGDLIKRRPGRPRGKTMPEDEREILRRLDQGEFGPVGNEARRLNHEQFPTGDEKPRRSRKAPDAPAHSLPRLSPLDWLNLRYAAQNFRAACEGENEPETIRLLRLISGVYAHVIRPGDSDHA